MGGSLSTPAPSPALRDGLWRLMVALARRDEGALESAWETLLALAEGSADRDRVERAVEEALLQSLLFLGFPAALTALARWRSRSGRPPVGPGAPDRASGEDVCRAVYGEVYEGLRARMAALHPAAERWMVEVGYGEVMGRPGLDLATREILNVALLSATDFTLQLHSHLRGALRAGVDPGLLRVVLLAATEHLPAARREDHLRRLEALVARGRAGPRGTR